MIILFHVFRGQIVYVYEVKNNLLKINFRFSKKMMRPLLIKYDLK